MTTARSNHPARELKRIANLSGHSFAIPAKKINDGEDLGFFFSSKAYGDLTDWLYQLNRAMFPEAEKNGSVQLRTLDSPPAYSTQVQNIRELLGELERLIESAPPHTGPRRFGNMAFRTWYKLAEDSASDLLAKCLSDGPGGEANLRDELKAYLLGGFGSAQRLDCGTGHELSFLAFLGCLWKLNIFQDGEEQAIVIGIIQPYLDLVRRLILTYTLEPAGSHGVWGLDDHSFLPYIFGSAQLGPAIPHQDPIVAVPMEGSLPSAPSPSSVTDKALVGDYKGSNMYFSAIQFIYDVKRGPFWEHSPVLYDISGIKDGWGKINKGMLKMYTAEVLGKFPVVQHFLFGSLFQWETDPNAASTHSTIHRQQQPPAHKSSDMPPIASAGGAGAGTKAPWAKSTGSSMPQMQASTGLPTTRMPAPTSRQVPQGMMQRVGSLPAPPPFPSRQQQTPGEVTPTAAPWAKNGG